MTGIYCLGVLKARNPKSGCCSLQTSREEFVLLFSAQPQVFFGSHLFLQRLRSIPPPLSSSYGSLTHTELRLLNPLWLHLKQKIPCFQIKPHSQVLRLGACVPLSWRHSSSCKVVSFVCVTLCMWQLILRLCRKATFRRDSTFCIPKPKRTSKK